MTTIETMNSTTSVPRSLTSEEIGTLVRAIRKMKGWTQETLAELSGLQTRTIQRVEQGRSSNADTRRALSRAFRLEDIDYFDALQVIPTEEQLQAQKEEFDRNYLLLDAHAVDGRQLLSRMREGPGFGALGAMSIADLPREVHEIFAGIIDYVRDCLDILNDVSQTELLGFGDSLDEQIAELRAAGFCLCAAYRMVKLGNKSWQDQTPLACQVTYLFIAPKDRPTVKVAVARKVSFGF